jgi:hypothetical protein
LKGGRYGKVWKVSRVKVGINRSRVKVGINRSRVKVGINRSRVKVGNRSKAVNRSSVK